ncbi:MAG: hypothetical protein ACAI35_07060 [Candidatus Methylacidiphilales bacterium]|nr:hypothetical protein [Candidatus Methylacidiphilales bacterium]
MKRVGPITWSGIIALFLWMALSVNPVFAGDTPVIKKRSSETEKASVLLKEEKPAEAEKILDKVLKQNNKDADAYQLRSFARSYQNNLQGALEDVTRSLELGPENVGKYRSRAIIYLQMQKYNEAVEDFEAIDQTYSATKKELDRETLMMIGVAFFCKGGEDGKASTYMFRAAKASESNDSKLSALYATWSIVARVAMDPQHKENYGHLLKMLKKEVDSQASDIADAKIKGIDVTRQEYTVLTGRYILGEVSEKEFLAAATARTSGSLCEACFYIAMHYIAIGNKAKAGEFLQQVVDLKLHRNMLWMMAEGARTQGL